MRWSWTVFPVAMLIAGCEPTYPPPPAYQSYAGLPVSGSLAQLRRAGFGGCTSGTTSMRCGRRNVRWGELGPYQAAADLRGSDGRGGFDHLTLWHDQDQSAVNLIGEALKREGWKMCLTGEGRNGNQAVYTRDGSPVWVSMDLSYWMKRRLRVFAGAKRAAC